MKSWAGESEFSSYLDRGSSKDQSEQQSTSSWDNCPTPAVGNRNTLLEHLLSQGIKSLNTLAYSAQGNIDLSAMIRQLRDTLRLVCERQSSGWSEAEQYQLIYPFSSWMTKYSISFISISEGDKLVLTILAHFYAVVVTLAIAFPAVDIPPFASIRLKGIIEADHIMQGSPGIFCGRCNTFHYLNEQMEYPLNTVHAYQSLWGNKSDVIEVEESLDISFAAVTCS